MEQQLSVNGVTVERNLVAKHIRESKLYSCYSDDQLEWRKLKNTIGNSKLRKADCIRLIRDCLRKQSEIKYNKPGRYSPPQPGRILELQRKKLERKQFNIERLFGDNPLTLSEGITKRYKASYNESISKIKINERTALWVTWDEESDWDYYSKSYNHPKNTYSKRRVQLMGFRPDGEIEKKAVYYVDSFKGQFLVDAVVNFFCIRKSVVWAKHKGLRKVMLSPYFRIILRREIAGVKIYERTLAGHFVDYCVLYDNQTYHSETIKTAISGLKQKIKARLDYEYEGINIEVAKGFGFCETGIRQFCSDNGLDIDSELTRRELRNVVVKNRKINCSKYQLELKKLGIILNCKSN